MKILLVLISTISVSTCAILFPDEMDEYKVSYDHSNRLGIIKDAINKANFLKSSDNEEDKLEPRNMINIKDFGTDKAFRNIVNDVTTIQPFQKEINNQEKVQPKKLRKNYNFYAKRIYKRRNNNQDIMNESIEHKIRKPISSPVKLIKKTKYSTEEKQDRKEFIFMKNKSFGAHSKDKRRKRSSNIIEEENLFTTVSALKYTGRDTRLTNDLYFKNINQ